MYVLSFVGVIFCLGVHQFLGACYLLNCSLFIVNMAESGHSFLSEEQLNLINRSIIENISKRIPEIIERVTPLIMEKIDTHLKQFWSNDKLNLELSFQVLRKKENISYITMTNYGLIYFKKEKILCTNLQDVNGY